MFERKHGLITFDIEFDINNNILLINLLLKRIKADSND